MGRIQTKRIRADTNVVSRLDSTFTDRRNPCTFNGIILSPISTGAPVTALVTVYRDNNDESITPTVNFAASANTITINGGSVSSFNNLGLEVGDLITITSAADSGNNRQHQITAITGTVITTDSVTDDATADAITIQKNDIIWKMNYNFADTVQTRDALLQQSLFTNGIFCTSGLRVESSSWTNLECFVLYS